MKKVQIFSSRPRPAWGRPRPASRPASGLFSGRPQAGLGRPGAGLDFWRIWNLLVGEMQKVIFAKNWKRL